MNIIVELGVVNRAVMPGSNTCVGVHAPSTFRMQLRSHRASISPRERVANSKPTDPGPGTRDRV